ncbi:hypothetical protein ACGFIV_32620 [Sphaerisporangium sp. NPDC049003]|uniref:hypothetical protein n=1 Tax=Sphaerisporangium sp. NPDC049003 TaxID=3364517 RepID=UPI0037200227
MNPLPSAYQWIDDLTQAHSLLAEATIPVLRPHKAHRADRWAHVLAWYGSPRLPARPAPAGARVAGLGGDPHLGELVAHALGRSHRHHTSADTLMQDLGPRGGTVLVVALARELTLAVLLPLLDSYAAHGTAVGLLTGRDNAAITFALAKILATPRAERAPGRSALIDGTTGLSHTLPGRNGERITTDEVLADTWRTLLIDAHGSAAHANLGAVVLCGLTGQHEHTSTGIPVPGGCTPARCKTDTTGRHIPLAPHDLKTQVLGLFVCNAITLGPAEQYPSDLSLILDAVEGYPSAVFGLLRGDLNTTCEHPDLAATVLNAGHRLGRCVSVLDHDGHRRGIRGPSAALIGDPEYRPHPRSRPAPADPTPQQTPSSSGKPDTSDLPAWQARIEEAAAFESALRASLHHRPDLDLDNCLTEIATHRLHAAESMLCALRSHTDSGIHVRELEEASLAWSHSVLAILSRTRGGAFTRQVTAARAHHRTEHLSVADPCPHCAAPRTREHLVSTLGLAPRITVGCPRCGAALSLPDHTPPLTIRSPQALHPGHRARIDIVVPDSADGLLAVHLRPRSTRLGSYDHRVIPAVPGVQTVILTIPRHPIPELDRLWVLHAHHFALAFHQRRIPTLPGDCDTGPQQP